MNSSQVACVNHLEPVRLDRSIAAQLFAAIEPAVVEPLPVEDGGHVADEWIGEKNYLNEPGARRRGPEEPTKG